jgi:hypothetical protein
MQQHWPHSFCYSRRAVFGLALMPWLVSAVRPEDAAAMPPQPEDLSSSPVPKRDKSLRSTIS